MKNKHIMTALVLLLVMAVPIAVPIAPVHPEVSDSNIGGGLGGSTLHTTCKNTMYGQDQGTPSLFNGRRNVEAWKQTETCPTINPRFLDVLVSLWSGHYLNEGRDIETAVKFWTNWKTDDTHVGKNYTEFQEDR